MTPLDPIEGLSITNFRSIRGTVSVPLDAPIVLIHGANGAGKTSILSALELTLTREIPAMKRDDEGFQKFLVHQGKKEALARLLATSDVPSKRGSIRVDANGTVTGEAFLDADDGRFFSDRCMLAQSVLSRLLQIYQEADPTKASALTHFVKDLLKLDQLDSVIDGLQQAGDVRNVRKLAPSYKEAEDLRKVKKQDLSRLQGERTEIVEQLSNELKLLQADLDVALPDRNAEAEMLEKLREELSQLDAGSRLLDERGRQRELSSLEKAWSGISGTTQLGVRSEIEARAGKASADASAWRETVGTQLEATTVALRPLFPDLPSWSSTSPEVAYSSALDRLEDDLVRLRGSLARDEENLATLSRAAEAIAQDQSRLKIIGLCFGVQV